MRPSGRAVDQMRAVSLELDVARHAEGSCLVRFGDTHVLCVATVEERVPPFLRNTGKGWVTAEYGMLPRSTNTRTPREAARGKQSGRTQEIQRLIGRSLRAVTGWTAWASARSSSTATCCRPMAARAPPRSPAPTSPCTRPWPSSWPRATCRACPCASRWRRSRCGIVGGEAVLDLDYVEDSGARPTPISCSRPPAGSSRSRSRPRRRPIDGAQFEAMRAPGAERHAPTCGPAAAGAGMLIAGPAAPGRHPQSRQAARVRIPARAARHRRGRGRGARPARARGDRRQLSRQRPAQGPCRQRRHRPAGAGRR